MNKSKFIIVSALFFLFVVQSVFSQSVNVKIKDPKLDNKAVLIGNCNREGLMQDEYGVYFESQYDMYDPAEKYISKLQKKINGVDIKIVFGSWCSDSKIQVPRFYKILDLAEYNEKKLRLIGVNRDKNAVAVSIKDLNIVLVPTFIVYQKGVELGRIVETPNKTLEKDLWKIVNKAQ